MINFTIRVKATLVSPTFIIHRCARSEQDAIQSARAAFPDAYRIAVVS